MCKLEMMSEGERKKRREIDEKVNVLVAALEREKNVKEKAEVEARNLREEIARLKGKERNLELGQIIELNKVEGGMG